MDSLKEGLAKLLRSRKFLTAVGGAIVIGAGVVLGANSKFLELLATGIGLLIAAWTVEDSIAKAAGLFKKK